MCQKLYYTARHLTSVMDQKLMYAFRGWIGFVAFMDMADPTLPRALGYYCILKALVLTHCTLFIHYKPVVNLGICSLIMALFMYLTEVFYYHSTSLNFYIAFPCLLNILTLVGLLALPRQLWEPLIINEDENVELLRQATAIKRRRHVKKTN
ncbi:conserved hypothetical protein [Pediculus humanus corporis]|uniref:Uncharacterized protein n=1 Tax=Pediculus humanus subsp. corporis TaxID=121224 RepID=E0VTQ1_PEDHC|nr:uncharacterized protein Phum_PHUM435070 [Pediculus humanus corporis]EEB16757.1 conserved hypothetical protein [Pediculus humanus corporis]